MKSYILNLTFEEIQPTIWRRVIMPAGATFNRLHETIQHVTNFQSILKPYHFFAFEVQNLFITNNEDLLEEYKGKLYFKKEVKQPSRIKIDTYLEKYGEVLYIYDFGDNWRIRVKLEDVVDDYYFGYPTLLDGEGTAPPEDVGGPPGYKEFLKVYQNPMNPDYLSTLAWAERQLYRLLNIDEINDRLKHVKYKKTQWEHIDHDNYFILSDKYRGVDNVDLDNLQNKELIIQYAIACTNLYGYIEYPEFLQIYNSQNEPSLSSKELSAITMELKYLNQLVKAHIHVYKDAFVHEAFDYIEDKEVFFEGVIGKPYYIPAKEQLLKYVDELYYEKTIHHEKLAKMMAKDFFGGSTLMVYYEIDELVNQLKTVQVNFNSVVESFLSRFKFNDLKHANEYIQTITKIANMTRLWENRGYMPEELLKIEHRHLKPMSQHPVIDEGKVGRNDSCPCGSGKKYKKCCGK